VIEKIVKAMMIKIRFPRTVPTATTELLRVLILDRNLLLKDLAKTTGQEATVEIGSMTNSEATKKEKILVEVTEEERKSKMPLFNLYDNFNLDVNVEETKTDGTLGETIETEMTDTATKTPVITSEAIDAPAGTMTAIAETMVQATGGEPEVIEMITTPPDTRAAAIDETPITIATATRDLVGKIAKKIATTGILQEKVTKETNNVMIKLCQGNS
jgi:hypothetical protein